MKQWHKAMILVSAVIIGIGLLGYGGYSGCRSLVRVIVESNSCERWNIDNIETRIPVGIPTIYNDPDCFSCILDKSANTKTNYFRIRTDVVEMDGYVERNFFIPINETDLDLSVFDKLTKIPEITSDNQQNFYYSLGIGKRVLTDWLAILDKKSGDLWVYMQYKD